MCDICSTDQRSRTDLGEEGWELHPWYVVGHAAGAHDQREDESCSRVIFDVY